MENFQIEKLKKENALLQKKLELATVANGRARNLKHLLAVVEEKNIQGETFIFKGEHVSASEFVSRLEQHPDYAHLFGGGSGGPGAKESNPWAKESFNLTQQMKLTRENPTLAAELKKQAKG